MSKPILGIQHHGGQSYSVKLPGEKPFYVQPDIVKIVKEILISKKIFDIDANEDNPEFNLELTSGTD